MSNFKDFLDEQLQDPAVKKEFEALDVNYTNESSLHLLPVNDMELIQFDGPMPEDKSLLNLVVVTENDYIRLTEDGIVKMVHELVYDAFEHETVPVKVMDFVKWQIKHLNRKIVRNLYEYLHFSLKHEKVNHRYHEQWTELCVSLLERADKLDQENADQRHIQYAYLGKNDRVYCLFQNGEWRVWDASGMREIHLMRQHIAKDKNFFRNALTIINDTIAWDTAGDQDPYECIDIDPSVIWEEGASLTMDEMVQLVDTALKRKQDA